MTRPLGPINVEMAAALRETAARDGRTEFLQPEILGFAIGFEAAWTLLHEHLARPISLDLTEARALEAATMARCTGN